MAIFNCYVSSPEGITSMIFLAGLIILVRVYDPWNPWAGDNHGDTSNYHDIITLDTSNLGLFLATLDS